MCDFLQVLIDPALPSSPTLFPTLQEGSRKGFKLPPLLNLGEEGWGGEGEVVAHRVNYTNSSSSQAGCVELPNAIADYSVKFPVARKVNSCGKIAT
jgi:hypothetical protein